MHANDARSLKPSWQRCTMDPGRRRTLIGLSAVALAAMGVQEAWAQTPRSCVLTPEAGEGPFYLDPKLLRSDITSGKPGAPLQLALQVVRAGDCATLANARVDVWHADAIGLYSGICEAVGRRWHLSRGRGRQAVPARNADHRRAGQRAVPNDIPELVRRPYAARPLQGLPRGQGSRGESGLLSRRDQQRGVPKWEPYREHASKRTTFSSNDPISQGCLLGGRRNGKPHPPGPRCCRNADSVRLESFCHVETRPVSNSCPGGLRVARR